MRSGERGATRRASLALIALALLVSACGISGPARNRQAYDDEGRERISILSATGILEADEDLATVPVRIPKPYINKNWAQHGGNAAHVPQHLALGGEISLVWRADIGGGDRDYERVVAEPVAADGKVFTVDVVGAVRAFDLSSGQEIWRNPLDNRGERSSVGFGGGPAYRDGFVYVTSGYGYVVSLDATSGEEQWRYETTVPLRGAPTVSARFVVAITQDNLVICLDRQSGALIWDQVGIAENAGVLGAASPAFDGETIVAGLSSGELIGMRASNGRIVWQDSVSSGRRLTPLSTLTDIDGNPVINEGRVFAVSHGGRMIALDMRTGERAWESDIAGVNTPWIAGRYGYTITIDSQVVCFTLNDGRIRWVQQLQRFRDQERRRGLITWNGPVLAGDRLILTSNHGFAVSVSPYSGEVLSGVELPNGSNVPPIVVDETLLVLSERGELLAYR